MTSAPGSPLFLAEIAAIDASKRLRPTDPARVEALAASMNEVGQQQPIVVRPRTDGANGLTLVAGAHRLEAAALLGWPEIAAIWVNPSEAEARLIEIDENLIRNELSEIDRAVSLAERKRIYEALHPETKHGGKRPKALKDQVVNFTTWSRFSKDAAKRIGLSESTVQKAVRLAVALSPDAIALIRGTALADNGTHLKELAALPPDQQVKLAREISEGRASNLAKARVTSGMVPEGGAVREEERLLAKIEPMLPRMSLADLQALSAMVASRIAALTLPAKPARAKKGGAA
ncbi:MAG: hypothetical protein DI537_11160 [Stutzerimonas stutzeri]|uniref:ParB/RepB/Spo0J family partition protein n=1 Tax=Bosea eneae TaxID=151454 RepID=A0ABW0J026_9HYPH|nr:MAG: hypothetical protein DI537_11160 [Stutzerimonas stutzeri]